MVPGVLVANDMARRGVSAGVEKDMSSSVRDTSMILFESRAVMGISELSKSITSAGSLSSISKILSQSLTGDGGDSGLKNFLAFLATTGGGVSIARVSQEGVFTQKKSGHKAW